MADGRLGLALVFLMRHFLVSILCLTLLQGCTGAFFQPQRTMVLTPARIGLDYRDVYLHTPDGEKLHAWYLPAQGTAKGTVLFLHGNAENISTHIASVYWLPAQHYNVLLFDYRGYGESTGTPSLPGLLTDAETAIAWLADRSEVRTHGMVVFGQSLGASLAVYAVAHSPYRSRIKALIIDSAFSSYRRITREKLAAFWLTWALQVPLSLTVDDQYSPINVIADISPIPLLIIHSIHDPIVPISHAEALYAAARQPKELWRVAQGGHIQALTHKEIRRRFVAYLDARFSGRHPSQQGMDTDRYSSK
jgi:fermentation-respiration switch protein FrsA (DUF1100 family)